MNNKKEINYIMYINKVLKMIDNIRWVLPKIQKDLELPQVHAAEADCKILVQDAGFNVLIEIEIMSKVLTINDELHHTKASVLKTFKQNGIHLF